MMIHKIKLVSIITLSVCTSVAIAQTKIENSNDVLPSVDFETIDTENETPSTAIVEKMKTEKQRFEEEEKPQVQQKQTKTIEQVFIPTEEISEDKPVPFPVDI